MKVSCKHCGKDFFRAKCHVVRNANGVFCSRVCMYAHKFPNSGGIMQGNTGLLRKYYKTIHAWLNKNYGRPTKCEFCEKNKNRYEWALKKCCSYEKKIDNYLQLCVSCHRKYDFSYEALAKTITKRGLKPPPNIKAVIGTNIKTGEVIEFCSVKAAAESVGVYPNAIQNSLRGKSSHSAGYSWKLKHKSLYNQDVLCG